MIGKLRVPSAFEGSERLAGVITNCGLPTRCVDRFLYLTLYRVFRTSLSNVPSIYDVSGPIFLRTTRAYVNARGLVCRSARMRMRAVESESVPEVFKCAEVRTAYILLRRVRARVVSLPLSA